MRETSESTIGVAVPSKVRDIMTAAVVTATADTPFPELVDTLIRHRITGVPVVDADNRVIGVVSEADLVSKVAFGGRHRRVLEFLADVVAGGETEWAIRAKGHTASQVMNSAVDTIHPGDSIRVAAKRLVEEHIKRLPVVDDDGVLVGIVTRGDLLRLLHRSDDALASDVAAMLDDPFSVPEDHSVEPTVTDGVVTLQGRLATRDLELLRRLVWQLPGVVDVRVEATARAADPDAG